MKIEVLYPEICCLYGDKGNMRYLQLCLPEAEFIYTSLNDAPAFLEGDIDLCYLCSMSEASQELVLERLMPWQEKIVSLMQNGRTLFLWVGNALELLGAYIQREDGSRVAGLGVFFSMYSVRQSPQRFNNLIRADFKGTKLIGYTSRFSHTYGLSKEYALCQTEIGAGMNPKTKQEGILTEGIIATYLLGPLLVANPDFTHYLLKRLGASLEKLPYEDAMRQAYAYKMKEMDNPDLKLF